MSSAVGFLGSNSALDALPARVAVSDVGLGTDWGDTNSSGPLMLKVAF